MRRTFIIFECIIAVFIDYGILGIRTNISTAYAAYHTAVQTVSYKAVILVKDITKLSVKSTIICF
jgi:hypothetical protein